jgi:catechol 2,3-dioxygenase-like lactoylglutathione lyase family enzyme
VEINHVGINVGDLDAAVVWYHDVFGFEVLVGVGTHTLDTPAGERRRDVFGPRWREMKLAHLATPSGVGIELFQFVDPAYIAPEDPFEYWRQGIFHVCFTVDDLEASLERLRAAGGIVRTQVHQIRPGTAVAYCEDPWGTIIELSSGTYRQIVGVDA